MAQTYQSTSTLQGNSIGIVYRFVENDSEESESDSTQSTYDLHPKPVDFSPKSKCPNCSSTQFAAYRKGFDFGSGLFGAIITGNIFGMMLGSFESDNIEVTCLNCGYRWTIRE